MIYTRIIQKISVVLCEAKVEFKPLQKIQLQTQFSWEISDLGIKLKPSGCWFAGNLFEVSECNGYQEIESRN